jgi:predicted permease
MNRPVSLSLRLYRSLARAFPYEFQNAYGEAMLRTGEEAIEPTWRSLGVWGLLRLLLDIALRLPAEYASEFRQDLSYGMRSLAASRGFTAVALTSLTLGIGVATAGFSELNGFIGRDVPAVRQPDQLVLLEPPTSYLNYQRYRDRSDLFTNSLAYIAPVPLGITIEGRTLRTWGHIVTASYFDTLGIHPALGRFFRAEDERTGTEPRVVVSYSFWRNHLGFDPAIIGKSLRINGHPCTILGVGPEDFAGASPMIYASDLWLPLSIQGIVPELVDHALERHDAAIFHVVGRLRPGVPEARAESQLETIARQLEQDYGDPNRENKYRRVTLLAAGKMVPIGKKDRPLLTGFMGVLGGVILLIAISNVINMMLARAGERRKEIAIRLAMGASRPRLIRQLLTESMIVAAAAGALGFLFASILMSLASRESMPYPMPLTFQLQPDRQVLLFAIALSAFTGIVFGLVPALQATHVDLTPALKEGGNVHLPRFRRLSLRNCLVLSEVAGSLSLLLITGFLVMGHQKMVAPDAGFETRNLYLISIDPLRDGYSPEQANTFFHNLLDRLKRVPAFTAASLADSVTMTMIGKPGTPFYTLEPSGAKEIRSGRRYTVQRDFFTTLGIPILSGRSFREEDERDDSAVAIVSEKLAETCWKNQNPIGRRFEIGDEAVPTFFVGGGKSHQGTIGRTRIVQVIGVARNVREGIVAKASDAPGVIYLPLRPADYARSTLHGMILVARAVPGVDAIAAVRREVAAIDDKITPFDPHSMTEQIEETMFPVKVALWTYGLIGVCGLILAAVGLSGVTAYSVARRRREIGIRVALGAGHGDVIGLVIKEAAVLVIIGAAIGILLARAGMRALSAVLFQIAQTAGMSDSDPVLLIGAPVLLGTLALIACYIPARQSLHIDPAAALRQE